MKNYKTMFYDNNKIIIGQYNDVKTSLDNKIENKENLITGFCILFWLGCIFMSLYINVGWKFFGFSFRYLAFTDIYGNVEWFSAIGMTILSSIVTGLITIALFFMMLYFLCKSSKKNEEIEKLEEQLRKKVADLGTTIYFDDIIAALSSTFTLSNDFRERLKNFIEGHYLSFDCDKFDPSGLEFDYLEEEEERLIIQHEGCTYYFKGWDYYEDLPFRFLFDKIHPDGLVEEIEYSLPVNI
jgi:hypothetical protein